MVGHLDLSLLANMPGVGFTALLGSHSVITSTSIASISNSCGLGVPTGTLLMPAEDTVALFLLRVQPGRGTLLIGKLLKNS